MDIKFITSNAGKFQEAKEIIENIVQVDLDLDEIQSLDPEKIIEHKLKHAFAYTNVANLVVEDTSLSLIGLNGLPGPLVKWFTKSLGNEGVAIMAERSGVTDAVAKIIIGYLDNDNKIWYFEGSINGQIVNPIGEQGFGWDPIFRPGGFNKTFGQMTSEEKNAISMRKIAFGKLRDHLNQNKIEVK